MEEQCAFFSPSLSIHKIQQAGSSCCALRGEYSAHHHTVEALRVPVGSADVTEGAEEVSLRLGVFMLKINKQDCFPAILKFYMILHQCGEVKSLHL